MVYSEQAENHQLSDSMYLKYRNNMLWNSVGIVQ